MPAHKLTANEVTIVAIISIHSIEIIITPPVIDLIPKNATDHKVLNAS